jgi:hypothetical protein
MSFDLRRGIEPGRFLDSFVYAAASWQDLAWFPGTYKAVWDNPVGLPFMGMGAVLMLTGCYRLFLSEGGKPL